MTGGRARSDRTRAEPPVLAIVGGMLGAGKTTLILEAAKRLARRGLRAAVVTNDQGNGLVDTALAREAGVPVSEVGGGCFCCRLTDLLRATDAFESIGPDVVFAEPVGSCTDLAATVLRPLLRDEPWRFRVAPLTVLIDPVRARALSVPEVYPDLAFLFRQQIAEADIVLLSKADEGVELPPLEHVVGQRVSARSGEGVDAWLDHVLGDRVPAGALPLVALDYTRYAAAEAALAWLNWHAEVDLDPPMSPTMVVGAVADRLRAALVRAELPIAHVKVLDQTASGYVRVSLCGDDREPVVDGRLDAPAVVRHQLLVNARVIGDPVVLSRVVSECVRSVVGDVTSVLHEVFRPAAPRPERRVTT
jgi:CobW/HypB/UreG, nucleotide-binding domain